MRFETIKKARKEKGLTQSDLASMLGVKRSVISKYENGSIEPSLTQIEKIAELLDVTPSFLIGYDEGANWEILKDTTKQEMQEEVWELYKQNKINKDLPQGFDSLAKLAEEMGYSFIWDNEKYFIDKAGKRVEVTPNDLNALVHASKTIVNGLLEDMMNRE